LSSEREKTGLTLTFTSILVGAALYFLYDAMKLITANPPQVAASLLATVIGLSLLSAGVTLLRTWLVSRTLTREESRESSE
jgi:hypothetical protein